MVLVNKDAVWECVQVLWVKQFDVQIVLKSSIVFVINCVSLAVPPKRHRMMQ